MERDVEVDGLGTLRLLGSELRIRMLRIEERHFNADTETEKYVKYYKCIILPY